MEAQRLALVTGGTRGIGRAICVALKTANYKVIASYSSNDKTAEQFSKATNIPVYKFDISNVEQCRDAVMAITEEHGPIEILINNAGITRDGVFHKMEDEQWRAVVDTNLSGCFHVSRAVIESMRRNLFGRIVNISSVNGVIGQYGQANYSAAKAGVLGFTRALAQENAGQGITVNAIAPGYVDTDMVQSIPERALSKIIAKIPVGRLGQPEDIARGVLFLVADDADFITGATLDINGGQFMH